MSVLPDMDEMKLLQKSTVHFSVSSFLFLFLYLCRWFVRCWFHCCSVVDLLLLDIVCMQHYGVWPRFHIYTAAAASALRNPKNGEE